MTSLFRRRAVAMDGAVNGTASIRGGRGEGPMDGRAAAIYYGGFRRKAGGAFAHAAALEAALHRRGWQVSIVTLDDLPFWCRYVPHLLERAWQTWRAPLGFLVKGSVTRTLFRALLRRQADLLVFEDVYLSWNSRTPSVTVLHAVWSDNLQSLRAPPRRVELLKKAEAARIEAIQHPVATVSKPYWEYLTQEHFGRPLRKHIEVVELGLPTPQQPPAVRRRKNSIVYVGTLEARKNLRFLLRVAYALVQREPSYSLTIIGDGPQREELESDARRLGIPARFLGRMAHDDVLAELTNHDTYVHTSVKESFSFALLEAKLAGLRTCAHAGLQVPVGFIDAPVPSFDVEAWCRAILSLPETPKPFDATPYTAERMTSRTLELVGLDGGSTRP